MCYNFETSVVSFVVVTVCGVVALRLRQPILGCLMLAYGLIQLSEMLIWRGIDTNNQGLNKLGTAIGKYTLPSHNIAIGVGVLIAYWASRKQPKYWIPLIVGILFYIAIMIRYATWTMLPHCPGPEDVTKACKYPDEKNHCTKHSARLEWPYPNSWYGISAIISALIIFFYVRPHFPTAALILTFFIGSFILTAYFGKRQVLGSYWCWGAAAFAPLLLILNTWLSQSIPNLKS